MAGSARGEVYFEFYALGNQVRVAAMDADTGTEVIIFGPLGTAQAELQRIAMAKLNRRIARDDAPVAAGKLYV